VLNLLTQLPDLQKIGLDTIRIDTFLHNEDWTIKITKIYLDALKHIDDKNYINNLACTLPVDDYSHGFYFMNQADLIYLKHDDTPLTYE
jgi:collagenase-like PrtC family protease